MYTDEFQPYKDAVVAAFLSKKKEAEVSWLIRPTRARIRKQYLQHVQNPTKQDDLEIFRRWLEMKAGEEDIFNIMKKKDADDFNALALFLKNTEVNTAEDNVEMIAVLIDYSLRPFTNFKKIQQNRAVLPATNKSIDYFSSDKDDVVERFDEQDQPKLPEDEKKKVEKFKVEILSGIKGNKVKWLYWAIPLVFTGALMIWYLNRPGCMYWKVDHYVAASCSLPRGDTPIVALNEYRLRNFRKIGRTDTLTGYARENFWYVKIGGTYEVFTESGNHPLYPDKQLDRVTDYVINVSRKKGQRVR